ncbi:TetR/AcrR family transcriptional regulator [Virgibacillus flavescens]|uniref:TetR/AcrR family transcriptional regulator n=1 Tax=Virgibacillus flavescens TaxID=1611422 RepID=UPI003D356618
MPKIVDHEKRKVEIAEATWKVIVNAGLEEATVRKIAKTANLSVGSLRHYFSTQSELLAFSMQLVSNRVKNRIENKNYDGPPLKAMHDLLCEFLPIDEDRRIEMEVWMVFSTRTLVDPDLKDVSEQVYEEIYRACAIVIDRLTDLGLVSPKLDNNMETERLYALVDGMALHSLLHPERFTVQKMQAALTYHLEKLCEHTD